MAKLSSHLLANHEATLQWSGTSISPLLSIHLNQHRDYGLSQMDRWHATLFVRLQRQYGSRGGNLSPLPLGPNSFVFTFIFSKMSLHRTTAPPTGNPGCAPDAGHCIMLIISSKLRCTVVLYVKFC